jgi:hypothetical protein
LSDEPVYRLEIEGRERNYKVPIIELPLQVWVDGDYLGRFILTYSATANGLVHCFTPYLQAGSHTVRIYWDNYRWNITLVIAALRVQRLIGPDDNSNGIYDWVEARLESEEGTELAPASSVTSPVCIEGRGQFMGMMEIEAGTNAITPQPGAGDRWYANVPLSATAATTVVISHQDGAVLETNQITWQVSNLLTNQSMMVRQGDGLLLTAMPGGATSGTVNITITGVTNYTTDVFTPVPHWFSNAGAFTVTGIYDGSLSNTITVTVIGAAFPASTSAWVGQDRIWACPDIPNEAVVEADPQLTLTQIRYLPGGGREFDLMTDAIEPRYVIARLGTNGPVLAATVVEGFELYTGGDVSLIVVEVLPDGSQVIEMRTIQSPVPEGLTIKLAIIVAGITFEGGGTELTLDSDDFDEYGVNTVTFIRSASCQTSVCHTTKVYEGTQLIGWPQY